MKEHFVPFDIFLCRELRGHGKSDDVFAFEGARNHVDFAFFVDSFQQRLCHVIRPLYDK